MQVQQAQSFDALRQSAPAAPAAVPQNSVPNFDLSSLDGLAAVLGANQGINLNFPLQQHQQQQGILRSSLGL